MQGFTVQRGQITGSNGRQGTGIHVDEPTQQSAGRPRFSPASAPSSGLIRDVQITDMSGPCLAAYRARDVTFSQVRCVSPRCLWNGYREPSRSDKSILTGSTLAAPEPIYYGAGDGESAFQVYSLVEGTNQECSGIYQTITDGVVSMVTPGMEVAPGVAPVAVDPAPDERPTVVDAVRLCP